MLPARTIRTIMVLAAAVVAVAGIAIGVAIYRERVKPYRSTVLEVDGVATDMGYFLKRTALSGGQPVSVLNELTREQILKVTAVNPPYRIVVTPEEVDAFARSLASGGGEPLGDAEFREWYRQQLNQTRFSDAEYRDFLRTKLLVLKMGEYLAGRVPTVAEQVYLNMIPVRDATVGAEVKERYDAGAGFAELARAYSLDAELREQGGRVGWFPRGALDPVIEGVAFALALRECSAPLFLSETAVVVIMVSQKEAAREIDDRSLAVLRSRALDRWYQEESPKHTVAYHGLDNGYDSETDAWVRRELAGRRVLPSQAESPGP